MTQQSKKKCECKEYTKDVLDTSDCTIHNMTEITTPFTSDGNLSPAEGWWEKDFMGADFSQDWEMASSYLDDYLDYGKLRTFISSIEHQSYQKGYDFAREEIKLVYKILDNPKNPHKLAVELLEIIGISLSDSSEKV